MTLGDEPYVFHGAFTPDSVGLWTFRVDGWGDPIHTWRHAVEAKLDAGQGESELSNDLLVGAQLLERAATGVPRGQRDPLLAAAAALRAPGDPVSRAALALTPEIDELLTHYPLRELVTRGEQYGVWVDRPLARFGSWYEMFPRSTGGWDADGNPVHGTFATAAAALPRIAQMGFDVVYLPPIHPIGKVHRKGRNNTATAVPGDVGSPWAIGSDEGGHDAVHPQLGTIADFDKFVAAVARPGHGGGAGFGVAVRAGSPVGQAITASGSPNCRTAPSPTPRTRRRNTRTSTRSTSTTTPPASTTRCCAWCGTGWTTASRSFASTTRTPSRRTSGPG